MQLLPVIDLKDARAVRAAGGRRSEYGPLVSCWTKQADDPVVLARTLRNELGCTSVYVADLNALEGRSDHRVVVGQLVREGFDVWLDPGVRSTDEAERWFAAGVGQLILASESLPGWEVAKGIAQRYDPSKLVFSVDLQAGRVRLGSGVQEWIVKAAAQGSGQGEVIASILEELIRLGLGRVIVLDTAYVGSRGGPRTLELCRWIRGRHPMLLLVSGGGVRSGEDLERLEASGVDVALISTALHEGGIGRRQVERFGWAGSILTKRLK